MAFISLTEKTNPQSSLFPKSVDEQFLNSRPFQIQKDVPPPGKYDPPASLLTAKDCQTNALPIPFNSTSQRVDIAEIANNSGFQSRSPGPGQYQIPSQFKSPTVFHDTYEPGTYYIMEDNQLKRRVQGYLPPNIIQNSTIETSLANGPRFRLNPAKPSYFQDLVNQHQDVPGPGQYNLRQGPLQKQGVEFSDIERNLLQKRSEESKGALAHKSRSKSQMKLRDLVLKEYLHIKAESNQVVSPASYTPRVESFNHQSSLWGKSKVERKTIFDKANEIEPANSSDQDQIDLMMQGQLDSVMKKSHSVSALPSTKKFYPKKKPTIAAEYNGEGDDYLTSDDENPPGPGQYYNSDYQTAFRKQTKDKEHQFFGSSTMRFMSAVPAKKSVVKEQVGPGSYNHLPQSIRQDFFKHYTSSFAAKKPPIDVFNKQNSLGSAIYDTQTFTYKTPSFTQPQVNPFAQNTQRGNHLGQTSRHFKSLHTQSKSVLESLKNEGQTPAPGSYNPFRSEFEEIVQNTERVAGVKIPQEQRFKLYDLQFAEQRQNPAPGQYLKSHHIRKRDAADVMFKSKTPRIMAQDSHLLMTEGKKQSKDCYMMTGNKELEKEEKDEIIEQKKKKMKEIYKEFFKQGQGKIDGTICPPHQDNIAQNQMNEVHKQYLEKITEKKQHVRMTNNFKKLSFNNQNSQGDTNFGKEGRFKQDVAFGKGNNTDRDRSKNQQPGPGQYANLLPNWNKRTFNLRFIAQFE